MISAHLEARFHGHENILFRMRFSGRRFLDLIAKHSTRIDKIKSEIDLLYNKIGRLKGVLAGYLGLSGNELVPETIDSKDPLIAVVHRKFFALLDRVSGLKHVRAGIYRKIAAIKKNWFGHLSNIEVALAKDFNGAIVREDLTVMAIEKAHPGYRGRTFNKMLNNGSKGQYIRRASDKFLWNGIPEVLVPSFYTSSTCTIHSLVDQSMRSGERFSCPICGKPRHADENASDTLANYLQLSPKGL